MTRITWLYIVIVTYVIPDTTWPT